MGTYVPNSREEQQEMLNELGVADIRELFRAVPEQVYRKEPLKLAKGLSELEVKRKMSAIAAKNTVFQSIFRGAGAYRHYIPSIVTQITSKEEFVTAYTPYQAEISQGVLQSIFEYQTMICELTGMDVSNASVYDGATAAAEAVIMCRERKRNRVLVSAAVHPQTIETIETYCKGNGMEPVLIPVRDGRTDLGKLKELLENQTEDQTMNQAENQAGNQTVNQAGDQAGDRTACVLLQQPNFYGLLEDCGAVGELLAAAEVKYILSCNPISLGILKTPAEYGADIAVGEGQPLGMPLSFGGPYLGYMATTEKLMRRLPGRIVGETKDDKGERAFVLTLQAREQHIRREKASSNICSNQALCAMTAAVYLDAMGQKGLEQAAQLSMSKAHYLAERLCEVKGFSMAYQGEYFNEFVTDFNIDTERKLKEQLSSEQLLQGQLLPEQWLREQLLPGLERRGILGGYPLGGGRLLWCATEMNTREEIDALIDAIKEVLTL